MIVDNTKARWLVSTRSTEQFDIGCNWSVLGNNAQLVVNSIRAVDGIVTIRYQSGVTSSNCLNKRKLNPAPARNQNRRRSHQC